MYLRNSFSDVCTILRRDSEQALLSTPGAFVDGRWRMFRRFSSTRKAVRQYKASPARFSNSGFPSRELKCNSSLNTKLMSAESGFLQPRPINVVSLFKLTIAFHSTVSITSDKPLLVLFKQLLSLRMESVAKMIWHKFHADIIFVFGAKLHPQMCIVAVTLSISLEYHKNS